MAVSIEQKPAEKAVGVRVVGPYAQSVPLGFQQLMAWQQQQGIPVGKWLVLYWDDPNQVAAEKLRADVVFTVADDFVLPAGSENMVIQTLPAGEYAVYRVRITDGDFATPWRNFYQQMLPASGYRPSEGVCYEHYLNDCVADGYFELEICQSVTKI
ncbi:MULTISPECIES: DNA gyrase inhibitor SbmC [Serratia]|uniref:DNA gyrase inhibitor n=1 Tax=Serratia fonticola TaxID=47917 RepID=A0AAE7EH51_SERFO|nr:MULTISPECIES: DNA gyrase inhibitor SbmC [Serratia]MCO7511233.1 DNA gyrase inhibitor SbmC [Serratia fonticola]QKJ58634.1 DNA gyrase inhibitor SbmC [Serratia fonticola]WMT12914.1 DNA gyrase inhibitor SbmC [Serratia fonticola]HEJ9060053.1 DNA gyrase inhibitor SbmC [Serratia fonticola]